MPDHQTRYDGIIVRCGQNELYYPMLVNNALAQIASKRLGRSLLHSIVKRAGRKKFGYTVCIQKRGEQFSAEWDESKLVNVQNRWHNVAIRGDETGACNGNGSVTAICWNPNLVMGDGGERPPFIALAHELIHAMNNLRGTAFQNNNIEEMATVGLGNYANVRKRNENAIRAEHHLPSRDQYTGIYP